MGLLDQLWDETVAGPRPDSGLGKLRNYPAQGGRLEEVPPENQGLRRAGAGRRAQEPHRLRLGGDQLVGPLS
ncbi:Dormancy-associated protein homolog 3 [Zea mays]|uniref:Dormancy-associated protein homolog 3 n=1 Tax=Zea mays TaxID=4577 RepID=A0A1D6KNE7_MAIZE|nr:Dormancy-associated protein homolog 3 [Zea mays]